MRTKATNEFKKRKKKEAIVLKAMIAIVAVAVLLTVFCAVFKWEWLMPIKQYLENENLRNAVLVFLQIQATIIALVMTVIALLSGIISESYMGISIPNYFLEKKSKWLNGRRILAIDFIAFIIEIVLYIASLYVEELMIVIIAGFAITLITTFWLSSTIYMALCRGSVRK